MLYHSFGFKRYTQGFFRTAKGGKMKKKLININPDDKTPIYKQIYKELKERIDRAELVENSKLPSIRQLSMQLGVNNLTILKAYNLLESKGYIYKKQGSGVFVKKRELSLYFEPPKDVLESFKGGETVVQDNIDFVSGTPANNILPFEDFKNISIKLLERDGVDLLTYHNTQGYNKLRHNLSERIKNKGINVSRKNIQIISGAQQGLDLILKVLLSQKNNKIIVGRPTYHGALNTFRKDCKIYSVGLEEDGFDLDELENILKEENIAFIYTMIDFESPTGISWSNEKRQKLVELARKYNTYIIEDDCLSDIYFDTPKIPLKSLDKNNKYVISIKSFSKVLIPGIRMGYMILPEELTPKVVSAKFTSDISSSGFNQRILLEFLEGGRFDSHLVKIRKLYKKRYELVKECLENSKLNITYDIDGGFYVWISLPRGIDGNKFYLNCKKAGVSILPGNVFFLNEVNVTHFRLSFAAVDDIQIAEGIKRMNKVIFQMMNL